MAEAKKYECEASFRGRGTDFETFATREEAEEWCRRKRPFRGFYRTWINNVVWPPQ